MMLRLVKLLSIAAPAFALLTACLSSAGPDPSPLDPWSNEEALEPEAAVKRIAQKGNAKPVVLHVGFRFLYRNARIPGTKYVGPGNESSGIEALRNELKDVSREREVILYCGCCPLKRCPNMRPTFKAVREMGFKKVRIIKLEDSFDKNWAQKGLPIEAD